MRAARQLLGQRRSVPAQQRNARLPADMPEHGPAGLRGRTIRWVRAQW